MPRNQNGPRASSVMLLLIAMGRVVTTASCALQLRLFTAHVLHRTLPPSPLLSEIINNCM